jgi:hypothetical protein
MSYSSATNGQRTHVYEVFDCYGSQLAFSLNEKKEIALILRVFTLRG